MPKNTNPTKTYQYRHVERFAAKVSDFKDEEIKTLINILVTHAKGNKILDKGTMLLSLSNTLDIWEEALNTHKEHKRSIVESIAKSQNFLIEKAVGRTVKSTLLGRKYKGSYVNLIRWYNENKINDAFISLSQKCCFALNQLDEHERGESLSTIKLLKIRTKLLSNPDIRDQIIEIMGNDLMKVL